MSQFTEVVQNLSSPCCHIAHNSVDRWIGLSNFRPYLLGSKTLNELLERATHSVAEILDLDLVKIFMLRPNGHYFCHQTFSSNSEYVESQKNSSASIMVEKVLKQVLATQRALSPCLLDEGFTSEERFAFSEGKYDFIWLVPLAANSQEIGFLVMGSRCENGEDQYLINSTHLVEMIAGQLSTAILRITYNERLTNSSVEMVKALTKTLELRDNECGMHSQNMAELSNQLAKTVGCSEQEAKQIYWAALLHDIGKIGVEDSILHKPQRLTDDEWRVIRKHPEIGAKIVRGLTGLEGVAPLIMCHHERLDGSGYPNGLKGDEIPLGARIIAVVDTFSAMVEGRVYQPKQASDEAIRTLLELKGSKYDPDVVDAFVEMVKI